jgi:hypothetical protein
MLIYSIVRLVLRFKTARYILGLLTWSGESAFLRAHGKARRILATVSRRRSFSGLLKLKGVVETQPTYDHHAGLVKLVRALCCS